MGLEQEMIMISMEKEWIAGIILVILAFALGAYFYPQLPGSIPIHWGISGEADGFAEKSPLSVFALPGLMAVLLCIFYALPYLDPFRKNYAEFRAEYNAFALILVGFLGYIFALSLAYSLLGAFNVSQATVPGFAALIFYAGIVLGKAKQNWFVGIRTPWTLSSREVWDKTHALGSRLFKAAAGVMLIGVFIPYGLLLGVALLLAGSLALFVYSYILYSRK
jgi:uncharacterized membrane protein